jgi:hypothetical protein
MIDFSKHMSSLTDEELLEIVIVKAFQYDEAAIEAANRELEKRHIPELEARKQQLISTYFHDLTNYADSDLKNYALLLKFKEKKSDKEVHHILKIGNLPEDRCKSLIEGFDSSATEIKGEASNSNVVYGALWFFGGIFVTFFSMSTSQDGGTYVVAFGAIIYGLIKMLNLA